MGFLSSFFGRKNQKSSTPPESNQYIGLAKLVDNLLRLESLPAHDLSSMIQTLILTQDMDQFLGGRSDWRAAPTGTAAGLVLV
jgi:hypothetical protein